jgi:hypothetical protein
LLRDNPSLRRAVGDIVARRLPVARRLAVAALQSHGEQPVLDPGLVMFDEAQVLDDWLPE